MEEGVASSVVIEEKLVTAESDSDCGMSCQSRGEFNFSSRDNVNIQQSLQFCALQAVTEKVNNTLSRAMFCVVCFLFVPLSPEACTTKQDQHGLDFFQ